MSMSAYEDLLIFLNLGIRTSEFPALMRKIVRVRTDPQKRNSIAFP